ncbi:MAG: hypothetical protein M3373_13210 [Gemmatimonadota bacterium]|nr:hypothetical protein [Gemmatimonadota bacterium]
MARTPPRRSPRRGAATAAEARVQQPLPIQPVPRPILCGPYEEPAWHWLYDTTSGAASQTEGRRPASYWYRSQRTSAGQFSLLAEEERDELPLVNALREDVKRWRKSEYEGATAVTKQLLRHWSRPDRARRLFFCQLEAAETVVYLTEILGVGKRTRFTPKLSLDDYRQLRRGERVSFAAESRIGLHTSLAGIPNEGGLEPSSAMAARWPRGAGRRS